MCKKLKNCKICDIELGKRNKSGMCITCFNHSRLGIQFTKEHKKNMSKAAKGRMGPLFGKHHSIETRKKISIANLKNTNPNNISRLDKRSKKCIDCDTVVNYKSNRCKSCSKKGKLNNMFGKITHGKWEEYKNIKMRSSWEVAYAKYLDRNNIKWEYESKVFDLGNCTYTPDFYLIDFNKYIEIKGYWRSDAKEKFRLFLNKYPNIVIEVLSKRELDVLKVLK